MMDLPNRHFKLGFNSELVLVQELLMEDGEIIYEEHVYDNIAVLFNFVLRGMKFSYLDDFVIDESAAERLPNGTWTGVVGLLNRSEVDYAPAALIMTEERWDAMAYNYPFAIDEIAFVTKKPEYSPDTMAVFRTLSPNVWLSLLACIVLVTLACFVAMKRRCTLGDILLHVLAIALNQEGNLVPRRAGEVLLLSTWLFAMAVFTFCFKSVLLSFLTFPPLVVVRTVPELAAAIRAGQYFAWSDYDEDFARYLQRSPNEDFRVIGESILKNHSGDDLLDESHEADVTLRSIASIADGGDYYYVSRDSMGSLYFATAVRKDFCCKDEMDMLVHRYLAAGINVKIDHLLHYTVAGNIDDEMADEKAPRKLTLTDLSGAFILLVVGHCLSVCVLVVECCIKRREGRHSSKRTV